MRTMTVTTARTAETKFLTPVAEEMMLFEPAFEALAPSDTVMDDAFFAAKGDAVVPADEVAFAVGPAPQDAVTLPTVAGSIKKAFEGGLKFLKFVDEALNGPDTTLSSISDVVTQNNQILNDIQDDLSEVQAELDAILAGIDGLSAQINTATIAAINVQAFDIFDMIANFDNPTSEQLDDIKEAGAEVMNSAMALAEATLGSAPAVFMAGQIAPAVMMATAARIAAADYASDQGLGESNVQSDIEAAVAFIEGLFSADGALGQQIEEEIEVETFAVYGFNGSHVFEFLVIETITGPGGSITHNVAGHHGYSFGESVSDDFPAHYTRVGSINGVFASGADPMLGQEQATLDEIADEVGGLMIDHIVPFNATLPANYEENYGPLPTDSHTTQLAAAYVWAEEEGRPEAFAQIVQGDLNKFGANEVAEWVEELPSTLGKHLGQFGGGSGGAGDDVLHGAEGGGEFAFSAADHISGGGGDDEIYGYGERDALFGESGYDSLYGGDGNDKLFGGNHDDSLEGGDGHDKLQGEHGRDTLKGGDGSDVLFQSERGDFFSFQDPDNFNQLADDGGRLEGGKGDDLMVGDHGGDDIIGGLGNDVAYGYDGADDIDGGAGNDEIYAGEGNDEVTGGEGEDTIEGGAGNDTIDGGWSDDTIVGGAGDDDITGGWGADTVIFHGSFHGLVSSGDIDDYALAGDHPESDFTVVQAANGDWIVTDVRDDPTDGVDIIRSHPTLAQSGGYGVEFLKFDNVVIELDPVVADPGYAVKEKGPTVNPNFVGAGDLTDDPYDPAWAQIGEAPVTGEDDYFVVFTDTMI